MASVKKMKASVECQDRQHETKLHAVIDHMMESLVSHSSQKLTYIPTARWEMVYRKLEMPCSPIFNPNIFF